MTSDAGAALAVVACGATDIGCVRDGNEDAWLVGNLDDGVPVGEGKVLRGDHQLGPVLIVCDGMGGVHGGEVASSTAVAAVWRELLASRPAGSTPEPEILGRRLRRAIRIAHGDIAERGKQLRLRGMGTTICAAAVAGDQLVLGTVGDSRAYLLRRGNLVQITRDQSVSSVLQASGRVDGGSGAILQALGVGDDVEPSLSFAPLCDGDRILLCSDGLYGQLGAAGIAAILAQDRELDAIARLLIVAARNAGGPDNITAVVAELGGARLGEPDDDVPLFREFDPQKEGDDALTATSHVVRRLAAQVGLTPRGKAREIPVTGQHAAYTDRLPEQRRRRVPATARFVAGSPARSLGWLWWLLAAVVVAVVAWLAAG